MTALLPRPMRSPLNMPGVGSIRSWHSMLKGTSVTLNPTLYATGTGTPPTVTQTGTLKRFIDLRVEVNDVSGGTARGQAKFRWSEDGGATWAESGVTTAATYPLVDPTLGANGLTLTFPAGTYAADHVYVGKAVQWNDQSLRGHHYTQQTPNDGSNLPKLYRNPTTGRWALRFIKAAGTYLRINDATYCADLCGGEDAPFTIFTVAGVYGTVGVSNFIHSITNTSFSTSEIALFAHTNSQWGASKRGASGSEILPTGGTVDNTDVHVFEHVQFGTTVALWVDGAQVVGSGGAGVAQNTSSLTVTEAFIGGIRSGANIYGDVDIYAQVAYVGALDVNARGFIRQLLKARYGTP